MAQDTVATYARRLAHVPGALDLLRHHPDGLPIRLIAGELGLQESALREELEVFFLTDVVDSGSIGLRSSGLEFLAAGDDGQLTEADLAQATVVRLIDDSPFAELGVAFLDAGQLGSLYGAASELSALEPDNDVLAAAVERLGASVLGGVDGGGVGGGGDGVFGSDVAAKLRRAASQRLRVRITYARAWHPGVIERVIEPYRVVSTRRGYEVDAGSPEDSGRVRTYLVTGVRQHEVLDEQFDRPDDIDDRVAAARQPVPVRVVVGVDRLWVVDRFAESITVEASDDDGVQLLAHVLPPIADRVGLMLAVAGEGSFVVEPAELLDADQDVARRLLAHHGLA